MDLTLHTFSEWTRAPSLYRWVEYDHLIYTTVCICHHEWFWIKWMPSSMKRRCSGEAIDAWQDRFLLKNNLLNRKLIFWFHNMQYDVSICQSPDCCSSSWLWDYQDLVCIYKVVIAWSSVSTVWCRVSGLGVGTVKFVLSHCWWGAGICWFTLISHSVIVVQSSVFLH